MEFVSKINHQFFWRALWVWGVCYLAAYVAVYAQFTIKADIAILTAFAERMLSGARMSEVYYEVNPPLSMIIFIPVVWLKQIFAMPIYVGHIMYVIALIAGSFSLVSRILKSFVFLDARTRSFFMLIFLLGCFITPSHSFGDREHLIVLGLVPFLLVQACITMKCDVPRGVRYAALAVGSLAVLIKPHYGLIPVVVMLHRIWVRRDLSVLRDADFWALTFGVIGYAGVLLLLFPDYLSVILPDVLSFYIVNKSDFVYQHVVLFVFVLGLLFLLHHTFECTRTERRIVYWLCFITLLLLVPYFVQGKGFDYHKIPWLFGYYLSCGVMFFIMLRSYLKLEIARIFAVLILVCCTVLVRPVPLNKTTHTEFQSLPLSQTLDTYCTRPCSFLFLNDASDLMHELALYHDAYHASRFTSLWFLMPILADHYAQIYGEAMQLSPEDLEMLKQKYAVLVAEDLKLYQPSVLIVLDTPNIGFPAFDFIEFLSVNADFKDAFSNYALVDNLGFRREIYYKGFTGLHTDEPEMQYSIYQLKKED